MSLAEDVLVIIAQAAVIALVQIIDDTNAFAEVENEDEEDD